MHLLPFTTYSNFWKTYLHSTHAKGSFPIILFLWYMAKADMRKFNVEKKSGAKKVRQ